MENLRENKPTADILMNSMRAMGYSFETAIADIVDNSISARATNIEIKFPVEPTLCYIAICDNGVGMSREELFDAMKYGSEKKRSGRAEDDLGRFGLGLKAASLSQCRKLTVASKKDGKVSALCWDLDIINEKKDWYVFEYNEVQLEKILEIEWLDCVENGTIVVWENFDIIEKSSGNVYAELSKFRESTANHLALIFHRFLNRVSNKLTIKINCFDLKGFDPFLENHNKTNVRRKLEIPVVDNDGEERTVTVQPYILPYQKDLTLDDKKRSGGIENYRSKQGFYVYRNDRLIVWGTWFGRHRDELTKYARIKVDIPNSLDDMWGLDIKKQNAHIPAIIKNRLTRAVDDAMDIAIKAQTYRGRVNKEDEKIDYVWDTIKERGDRYTYKINRNSRIFDLIKGKVDDETWTHFDMILEEIEMNIPFQQIYIHQSQNKISEDVSDERLAEIEDKANVLINISLSIGTKARKEIVEELFLTEPFNKFVELKSKLME